MTSAFYQRQDPVLEAGLRESEEIPRIVQKESRLPFQELTKTKRKDSFAFIVHPLDISYVYKKYPFAKYLPKTILNFLLKLSPSVILSEITDLYSKKDGRAVKGYLIAVPLTTKQMLENKKFAQRKILQTIKVAEKRGVVLVGLDMVASHVTNGGLDLLNKTKIAITNGRTLTAGVALEAIKQILKEKKTNFEEACVAIIGATELVGQAVSKFLARENISSLILIGKTLSHLEKLKNEIKTENSKINLKISTETEQIKNANIVVVTTANPNVFIRSEYLKHSAVVYKAYWYPNLSPNILNKRPNISLIEGSLISTPGINYHFDFGLPKGVTYSCLAETMLLAAEKIVCNYSIGKVDMKKVEEIIGLAKKYNFNLYLR